MKFIDLSAPTLQSLLQKASGLNASAIIPFLAYSNNDFEFLKDDVPAFKVEIASPEDLNRFKYLLFGNYLPIFPTSSVEDTDSFTKSVATLAVIFYVKCPHCNKCSERSLISIVGNIKTEFIDNSDAVFFYKCFLCSKYFFVDFANAHYYSRTYLPVEHYKDIFPEATQQYVLALLHFDPTFLVEKYRSLFTRKNDFIELPVDSSLSATTNEDFFSELKEATTIKIEDLMVDDIKLP